MAAGSDDPGRTDFLTVYETADVGVLSSADYLARLEAPTELTRRVVSLFREFRRSACRISTAFGTGSTGRVVAVELDPDADISDSLGKCLPRLVEQHQLLAASVYEPDTAVTAAKATTSEGRSTAGQDGARELPLLLLEPARTTGTAVLRDGLEGCLLDTACLREFVLAHELRADVAASR